jgi:protein TonB
LFESVVISTKKRSSTRQWLTLPAALAVHGIAFGVLAVASFLTVETIQAPPLTISFTVAPPPPPPPPPPARRKAAPETPQVAPTVKAEIVQPTLVPKETPAPGPALGNDESEEYGEEGGVEGGVVGGVIGGVVGGVIGGVSGGLLGSEPLQAGIGGVSNPELILETRVQPKYPEIARKAKVAGRVILQAIVRQDGSVGDIQVLTSPGKSFGFDESAVEAVRQWRYKPGLQNGKPVDVYFTVVVEFTLR